MSGLLFFDSLPIIDESATVFLFYNFFPCFGDTRLPTIPCIVPSFARPRHCKPYIILLALARLVQ